jgi:ribosome biogenesis SPOUT family RNA methylase Rps3
MINNDSTLCKKFFVVENCEEEFGSWLFLEYSNIANLVSGLYGQKENIDFNLMITNFNFQNQDDPHFLLFLEKVKSIYKNKVQVNQQKIMHTPNTIPKERICLLDMRAETTLNQEDLNKFDYFLYGGILGDHPPKDRTKNLRDQGYEIRRLGVHQMPTDVAIHTSKMILEGQSMFENINFITDPNIPIEVIVTDPVYNFLSDFYIKNLNEFVKYFNEMNEEKKKLLFKEDLEKVEKMMSSEFNLDILFRCLKFDPNYYVNENTNLLDFSKIDSNKFEEIYSMTGFRYIADKYFSWKIGKNAVYNFPLVSPGMLKLWKNYFSESLFN